MIRLPKIIIAISALSLLSASCFGPLGGGGSVTSGVAKTTNGGADWQIKNQVLKPATGKKQTTPTASPALDGADIAGLVFTPNNSDIIYAASSNLGVYRSDNAADTWTAVLTKVSVYEVAVDPTDGQHIYAVGLSGGQGTVLESKDAGKSWQEIYHEVSPKTAVTSITLNPSRSADLVIGLNSGQLIKSSDAGHSWTLLHNVTDPIAQIRWLTGGLFMLTKTKGLFRSVDGGQTFANMSESLLRKNQDSGSNDSDARLPEDTPPSSNISTFFQFAVSKTNQLLAYVATDLGLFKTSDGGMSWSYLRLPIKTGNLAVPITAVAIGRDDNIVLAGASNTVYKSLNAGSSWQIQPINTQSTVISILVHPTLDHISYVGLSGGHK